jgi:hypothetical protein
MIHNPKNSMSGDQVLTAIEQFIETDVSDETADKKASMRTHLPSVMERCFSILKGETKKKQTIVQFSDDGMHMHVTKIRGRVQIICRIGCDVFSSISCRLPTTGCYNLHEFSRRFTKVSKQTANNITICIMSNDAFRLTIWDYNNNQIGYTEVADHIMGDEYSFVRDRNIRGIYPVLFRMSSQDMLLAVDGMPSIFTVSIDPERQAMDFTGVNQTTKNACTIPITHDDPGLDLGFERVVFNLDKNSMFSVVKACRSFTFVYIGIKQGHPMLFHFFIREALEHPSHQISFIQIFVDEHISTLQQLTHLTAVHSTRRAKRPFNVTMSN